jgi:hypothetical protein
MKMMMMMTMETTVLCQQIGLRTGCSMGKSLFSWLDLWPPMSTRQTFRQKKDVEPVPGEGKKGDDGRGAQLQKEMGKKNKERFAGVGIIGSPRKCGLTMETRTSS